MDQSNDRRSRSVLEFSRAHGWSVWFTYKLAREGNCVSARPGVAQS